MVQSAKAVKALARVARLVDLDPVGGCRAEWFVARPEFRGDDWLVSLTVVPVEGAADPCSGFIGKGRTYEAALRQVTRAVDTAIRRARKLLDRPLLHDP